MADTNGTNGNGAAGVKGTRAEIVRNAEGVPTRSPVPEWAQELVNTYLTSQGHAFALHGNVSDIDSAFRELKRNVADLFTNTKVRSSDRKWPRMKMDIFVVYSRANGFTFIGRDGVAPRDGTLAERLADEAYVMTSEEMREEFTRLVSAAAQAPAAATATSPTWANLRTQLPGAQTAPQGQGDYLADRRKLEQALEVLRRALAQHERRVCLIVDTAESVFPTGDFSQIGDTFAEWRLLARGWGTDYLGLGDYRAPDALPNGQPNPLAGKPMGHLLIAVCDDLKKVDAYIGGGQKVAGWMPVEVGFPTRDERLYFVNSYLTTSQGGVSYRQNVAIDIEGVSEERLLPWLSDACAGLRLRDVEGLFLVGQTRRGIDRKLVKDHIDRLIREEFSAGGDDSYLEIIDPTPQDADLGGLAYLTDNLEWRIRQFQEDRLPHRGILLSGPPGTGKSTIPRWVAHKLGRKAVMLKPSAAKNMYVGESERRLTAALSRIRAMEDCMVFVDELDQAFPSRDVGLTDTSGVGGSMLGIFMEFMAHPRNKNIFWMGATNHPELIDAALKRHGRFGIIVPVLPPGTDNDRADVIETVFRRDFGVLIEGVPGDVLDKTRGFTQAQLQGLVAKAFDLADKRGERLDSRPIDFLEEAAAKYRPDTKRTQAMITLALSEVSDEDLIPPGYEDQERTGDAVDEALRTEAERSDVTSRVAGGGGRRGGL